MGVSAELGLTPVINVAGTSTRVGGPLMHPAAVAAMAEAARSCVPLDQLEGVASAVIGEVTSAEAGYVTAGAAAGLTLGAAAYLAGLDLAKIERLPDTTGSANEIRGRRGPRHALHHPVT